METFRGYLAFQPGFRKHDDFRIPSVGFVFWNSSFVPTYFVLWEKMRFRGGRHEVRDYGKVGLAGISVQILLNSTFGRRCAPNLPIHGLNFVHDFRSAIWLWKTGIFQRAWPRGQDLHTDLRLRGDMTVGTEPGLSSLLDAWIAFLHCTAISWRAGTHPWASCLKLSDVKLPSLTELPTRTYLPRMMSSQLLTDAQALCARLMKGLAERQQESLAFVSVLPNALAKMSVVFVRISVIWV